MNILGVSQDDKYLFTDMGFYLVEDNTHKFIKYNQNIISELFNIYKSDIEYKFKNGVISLQERILSPKKFINLVLESFEVSEKTRVSIDTEWLKKNEKTFMINENSNSLLIEEVISESWNECKLICENWWDNIKQGASNVWGNIKKGASKVLNNVIIPIIKKGVLPFLRWIRRGLNTYIGMVVDIIASLFPTVVVMKAIWGMIVMLDIYEIGTGDYDPKDPMRAQAPILMLIPDVISLIFTAAAGKIVGTGIKSAGVGFFKTLSPALKTTLTKVIEYLPKLKPFLDEAVKVLTRFFGTGFGKFLGKIFSFLDKVIQKIVDSLLSVMGRPNIKTAVRQTISSFTGKELKKSLLKLGIGGSIAVGLSEIFSQKSFKKGDSNNVVKSLKSALNTWATFPEYKEILTTPLNNDSKFDDQTEKTLKKFQDTFNKKNQNKFIIPVTGVLDPVTAYVLGLDVTVEGSISDRFNKSNIGKGFNTIMSNTMSFIQKATKDYQNKYKELNVSNI